MTLTTVSSDDTATDSMGARPAELCAECLGDPGGPAESFRVDKELEVQALSLALDLALSAQATLEGRFPGPAAPAVSGRLLPNMTAQALARIGASNADMFTWFSRVGAREFYGSLGDRLLGACPGICRWCIFTFTGPTDWDTVVKSDRVLNLLDYAEMTVQLLEDIHAADWLEIPIDPVLDTIETQLQQAAQLIPRHIAKLYTVPWRQREPLDALRPILAWLESHICRCHDPAA